MSKLRDCIITAAKFYLFYHLIHGTMAYWEPKHAAGFYTIKM